jgi:hypothetical protein
VAVREGWLREDAVAAGAGAAWPPALQLMVARLASLVPDAVLSAILVLPGVVGRLEAPTCTHLQQVLPWTELLARVALDRAAWSVAAVPRPPRRCSCPPATYPRTVGPARDDVAAAAVLGNLLTLWLPRVHAVPPVSATELVRGHMHAHFVSCARPRLTNAFARFQQAFLTAVQSLLAAVPVMALDQGGPGVVVAYDDDEDKDDDDEDGSEQDNATGAHGPTTAPFTVSAAAAAAKGRYRTARSPSLLRRDI